MPKLDGTGPLGQGAGSGRGRGFCGFRLKRGRGFESGYGFGFRRFISPKNELVVLEDEEKMLMEELEVVRAEKEAFKV